MATGILYAIITILNNLSCIIHIITTHKSSLLLLQMDLSIFNAPPPSPKKKVFEDTPIFGQTIVELIQCWDFRWCRTTCISTFQKHAQFEKTQQTWMYTCMWNSWHLYDKEFLTSWHPRISAQDTKCKRQSVSPIQIQLPNDLNMIRCSGHNNSHLMSVNKLPILFIHHYLYLSK